MTSEAVLDFQRCANAGALHDTPSGQPESGELDAATITALFRAFVHVSSPTIRPEALHPTHPEIGCTEYNPLHTDPTLGYLNRRVSLAIHDQLPPHHDAAPCQVGNHDVCPVTQPADNCMWFREHFIEKPSHDPVFFDFQWLKRPGGGALLSVLTNLPSNTEVQFQVWRNVPDFDGTVRRGGSSELPARGEAGGVAVVGQVRNGVCFAMWTPPDAWSPFEVEEWFRDADEGTGLRPPLFSVHHPQGWAYSTPPGVRLDRLIFSGKTPPGAIVMLNTGNLVRVPEGVLRIPSFDHIQIDEHPMAVGASIPDGWLEGVHDE